MNEKQQTQTAAVAAQRNNGLETIKGMLGADKVKARFEQSQGRHADAFIASLLDLYSGDISLQKCDPVKIINEALKASSLQLPINKSLGLAYIVVYNNSVRQPDGSWKKVPTPTFITGYKGLIQLALRTGQYRTINADIVYEGELRGADKLTGGIDLSGERTGDKVVGYFAHIELVNGFRKTLYMSVEDMAAYAKRYSPSMPREATVESLVKLAQSASPGKAVGWMGNFNDMAQKTVLRRLLGKYGFLSVEMQGVMSAENTAEAGQRDNLIAEGANSKEIVIPPADFDVVPDEGTVPGDSADGSDGEEEPY